MGRIQLLSLVFAVLVPLWSVIDYFVFPYPQWIILTGMRFVSAMLFAILAWPWKVEITSRLTYMMMALMLIGPPTFYLASLPLLSGVELDLAGRIATSLYGLLPFVVLAGLSIFPLTALELITFGAPFLGVAAYGTYMSAGFTWEGFVGTIWLAFLLFGASMFSSMSLLRYMIALVSQASQDPLTHVFTRQSGSEMIDMQFRVATRQKGTFSILFLDLDHFKSINDTYGHDEGDKALCMFVECLQDKLRGSDTIIRWGGEEFLVALPNTDKEGARLVINRIITDWLGVRPDGEPLTASIGVSERKDDDLHDWHDLIEMADARMYEAKRTGRRRAVFGNEMVVSEESLKEEAAKAAQ